MTNEARLFLAIAILFLIGWIIAGGLLLLACAGTCLVAAILV